MPFTAEQYTQTVYETCIKPTQRGLLYGNAAWNGKCQMAHLVGMYCIHFYQCNEHGNRANIGEGGDTYLHIANKALIRNARTTNVAAL